MEEFHLGIQILDNRLNHYVCTFKLRHFSCEVEVLPSSILLCKGHFLFFYCPVHRLPDPVLTPFRYLIINFLNHDIEPALGSHFGYSTSHQPASHHTDSSNVQDFPPFSLKVHSQEHY